MERAKAPLEGMWRYDYVKLTFRDASPQGSRRRFDRITEAVNLYMGDAPIGSWREPKQTFLAPGESRPNGLHIVEIWGVAADAVTKLPWEWVEYLTYAHVKTYVDVTAGESYETMLNLFDQPGYRKTARTTPRRQRHSKKDSRRPGLQIGSKKSSLHFGIYVRPWEKVGVEGRFRDERLWNARDLACVAVGEPTDRKARGGWVMLLRLLAKNTWEQLDYEWLSRDREIGEFFENLGTARRSPWSERFHGPAPVVEEPEELHPEDDETAL